METLFQVYWEGIHQALEALGRLVGQRLTYRVLASGVYPLEGAGDWQPWSVWVAVPVVKPWDALWTVEWSHEAVAHLLSRLLMTDVRYHDDDPLHVSTLQEVANIMAGSFFTRWGAHTGEPIRSEVPRVMTGPATQLTFFQQAGHQFCLWCRCRVEGRSLQLEQRLAFWSSAP